MHVSTKPSVSTCLWYDGAAEDAVELYTSLIPGSRTLDVTRFAPDGPVVLIEFTLGGVPFQALNGGPQFAFTEAASISVSTIDQAETDRLWGALTAGGGEEGQCGWLKDRFGVSWQIVPRALTRMLRSTDERAVARVLAAMHGMRKIDIELLETAYRGDDAAS